MIGIIAKSEMPTKRAYILYLMFILTPDFWLLDIAQFPEQ